MQGVGPQRVPVLRARLGRPQPRVDAAGVCTCVRTRGSGVNVRARVRARVRGIEKEGEWERDRETETMIVAVVRRRGVGSDACGGHWRVCARLAVRGHGVHPQAMDAWAHAHNAAVSHALRRGTSRQCAQTVDKGMAPLQRHMTRSKHDGVVSTGARYVLQKECPQGALIGWSNTSR